MLLLLRFVYTRNGRYSNKYLLFSVIKIILLKPIVAGGSGYITMLNPVPFHLGQNPVLLLAGVHPIYAT